MSCIYLQLGPAELENVQAILPKPKKNMRFDIGKSYRSSYCSATHDLDANSSQHQRGL